MNLAFAAPTEWWIEIPPNHQTECWQSSQFSGSPTRRHERYLNQLCLTVFLPWFQAHYAPESRVWPEQDDVLTMGEMVSGLGITVASKRLVLIPTDTLGRGELNVPQEWVDSPSLAADYYLAIQINSEERWIRAWGYTSHRQLKQSAYFDAIDRTYCVQRQDLIPDLNAFWNVFQLCPDAETQVAIATLPPLTSDQAEAIIQQLSQTGTRFPRLAIPFDQWGALMSHRTWRQQLYQSHLDSLLARGTDSTPTYLGGWFQDLVSPDWQSPDHIIDNHFRAPAFRAPAFRKLQNASESLAQRAKLVTLQTGTKPDTVVMLVMKLNMEPDGRIGIRAQLHPHGQAAYVPEQINLAIYSDANEMLQSTQAYAQVAYIRLPHFKCELGTQFRIQVALAGDHFNEMFIV